MGLNVQKYLTDSRLRIAGTFVDTAPTTGTNYLVFWEAASFNQTPTAPTWDSPTDGSTQDVDEAVVLDWTFNDPDGGDTQSAYRLRRTITATVTYWNGSTWQASADASTKITSTTSSHTLAASWGSDSDADHKYAVATWDNSDAGPSPFSSDLRLVPSAQDNPTITTPTPTGTPTISSTTSAVVVSDTSSTSDMDAGTLEYDSGVVVTGTKSDVADFPTNSVTRYVRVMTWNDEGLASDIDEVDVSVSYTPPSTPTLVNTSGTPTGAVTVTITNPGAGATEVSNDVYRRVGDDSTTEIRIATGVAVDGAYIDYTVASGVTYKYLARCFADNGTYADSAWTS